jgi:hypothetical protein
MRDIDRIEIVLNAIERLWRKHADFRLGQLVCNVASWADPLHDSVWDLPDEVILAQVERHLAQLGVDAEPSTKDDNSNPVSFAG